MHDAITILEEKAILAADGTIICYAGAITVALMVIGIMISTATQKEHRCLFTIFLFVPFILFMCFVIVLSVFFPVPTGKHIYRVAVDEENITLSEWNDLQEKYHIDTTDDPQIYKLTEK